MPLVRNILLIAVCSTFAFRSLSGAAEAPDNVIKPRYFKTLEGMPEPSNTATHGTVTGVIQTSDKKPLANADFYIFDDISGPTPEPEKFWRTPDYITKTDDKGRFRYDLPFGKYYLAAVQRKTATTILSPPMDGDIFYYENRKHEILPGLIVTLEPLTGAKPFSANILSRHEGITAIEGKVFDAAGKPVQNAIVSTYIKSVINGRAMFGSALSDKSGAYQLRVPGGGTYYLKVREIHGLIPKISESLLPAYGGSDPEAVMVKDGEILKDINISSEKILLP